MVEILRNGSLWIQHKPSTANFQLSTFNFQLNK